MVSSQLWYYLRLLLFALALGFYLALIILGWVVLAYWSETPAWLIEPMTYAGLLIFYFAAFFPAIYATLVFNSLKGVEYLTGQRRFAHLNPLVQRHIRQGQE